MKSMKYLLLAATMVVAAACQNNAGTGGASAESNTVGNTNTAEAQNNNTTTAASNSTAADAGKLVNDAAGVVQQMRSDKDLAKLMDKAQGVFIVPDYGKGAVIVGGRGGEGVLLARNGTTWSAPAFYDIGGVSIGAQIGGGGGPIAMLLMTKKAVDAFKGQNNFSFNANAGFNIVDYNAHAQASVGKGDVVLWSNIQGAFAGASLGVSDINFNSGDNNAYYGKPNVTAEQILTGKVIPPPGATNLETQLQA